MVTLWGGALLGVAGIRDGGQFLMVTSWAGALVAVAGIWD